MDKVWRGVSPVGPQTVRSREQCAVLTWEMYEECCSDVTFTCDVS